MPAEGTSRRVAVLSCGAGELAIALAVASPDDSIAGFDTDPAAIVRARRAAGAAGVADRVTFEVAATLLGHDYDLIFAQHLQKPSGHKGHLMTRPGPDLR